MKLRVAIALVVFLTGVVAYACNQTEDCPIDEVTSVKVKEEVTDKGVVIGVYEHQLIDGSYHRFRKRCN